MNDRVVRSQLPKRVDDITATWLSEALGTRVIGADVVEVISGAATKIRMRLSGPGVPETVIVKAPLSGTEQTADTLSFFAGEVAFYEQIAPMLDIGVPRCWYSATDADQALVVLEDLTGARFHTAGDTLPADDVELVLDVLAQLHAATWGERSVLERVHPYPGAMRPVLTGMLSGRYWEGCLARPRSDSIPAPLREPGALRAAIEDLWAADARSPSCVIHGDAHIGNAYFDGRTAGLLDWQMCGAGHWCHDVAYFIVSALDPGERGRVERELLDGYRRRLAERGGPHLASGDAWSSYRRHLVHGLFWATNADGMYPEEINARVVERFTRALGELDALDCRSA